MGAEETVELLARVDDDCAFIKGPMPTTVEVLERVRADQRQLRDECSRSSDTWGGMPREQALPIFEKLGFEQVSAEWWMGDTGLLHVGSHPHLFVARFFFNMRVTDAARFWRLPVSGHFIPELWEAGEHVWSGELDAVNGFAACLSELRAVGSFLVPWAENAVRFRSTGITAPSELVPWEQECRFLGY